MPIKLWLQAVYDLNDVMSFRIRVLLVSLIRIDPRFEFETSVALSCPSRKSNMVAEPG